MTTNESSVRRSPLAKYLVAGILFACLPFGFWLMSTSDESPFAEWDGSNDGQIYRPRSYVVLGAALALHEKGKEFSRAYNPFPGAGAAIESLTAPAWNMIEREFFDSLHHLVLPNMSFEDAPEGILFLNLKESPDGTRTAYRASVLGRGLGPQVQVQEHATGSWTSIESPAASAARYVTIEHFAWLRSDSLVYVDEYMLNPAPADPMAPGAWDAYNAGHKMSLRTVALSTGEHRTHLESSFGDHCVAAGDDGSFYFAEVSPGAIRVMQFDGDSVPNEVLLPLNGSAQHLNIVPSRKEIWFTHRTIEKGQCDGIGYFDFSADRPVMETFAGGTYLFYWSPGGRYMAYGSNSEYMLWDSENQTSTVLGRAGHLPYILGFSGNDSALIMRGYRGGYVSGWEMAYGDMTQKEGVYRFRITE